MSLICLSFHPCLDVFGKTKQKLVVSLSTYKVLKHGKMPSTQQLMDSLSTIFSINSDSNRVLNTVSTVYWFTLVFRNHT